MVTPKDRAALYENGNHGALDGDGDRTTPHDTLELQLSMKVQLIGNCLLYN